MENIISVFEKIKEIHINQIIDIIIAIAIYLVFRILSKKLAYITIRMFNIDLKNKRELKNNTFYNTLKVFYVILGIYLAILFLKVSLNIDETLFSIINRIFKIAVIVVIANGISNTLTINSNFIKKIKQKLNPELEDTMFKFILKAIRVVIYIIAGFFNNNRIRI